jgi:MFS transporter, FSR family, fosmidomycin resistance protein
MSLGTAHDAARHRAPQEAASGAKRADDMRTIALVSLAHAASHFHHMLLPPLFPRFIGEFGLSWSQLGLLVTLFFVVSGVGQALAGFVVDRIGARPVLFAALGCFVLASIAAATAQGYGGLLLATALAGLGNCPFHPADFTVLNKRVSPQRLGHAFSVHGICGNLGWAVAPLFIIGIAQGTGSWRLAYVASAVLALGVLLLMLWQRRHLDDRSASPEKVAVGMAAQAQAVHALAFLRLPSVWLCFLYFFWSTAALSAIQSFAAPALGAVYGLPMSSAAYVVTAYLLCSAAGMVLGGYLVARDARLERNIALAMAFAAGLLLLVATGWLHPLAAAAATALAGAGSGLAGPSRDLLIKAATPPGASGRVYGTVYSGLDVGFAVSAPVFGWLMDHAMPRGVFVASALALAVGVACAGLVSWSTRSRAPLVPV